jgi:hypothetical protein
MIKEDSPRVQKRKARDKKLTERFLHFYNIKRMRKDDALKATAAEFFLEESTVLRILSSTN